MRLKGLYLTLFSLRRVPVRLHLLTIPVAIFFFGFRSGPWGAVAILGLILAHELGHAYLVRRFKARVLTVDLLPFGGECSWEGDVTALQRALISWGGVMAQAVVLVPAVVLWLLGLVPAGAASAQIFNALIWTNLWMMGFNLLPIPPLDGSKAWAAIPMAWRRRQRREAEARDAAVNRTMRTMDQLDREAPPPEVKDVVKKLLDDARKQ